MDLSNHPPDCPCDEHRTWPPPRAVVHHTLGSVDSILAAAVRVKATQMALKRRKQALNSADLDGAQRDATSGGLSEAHLTSSDALDALVDASIGVHRAGHEALRQKNGGADAAAKESRGRKSGKENRPDTRDRQSGQDKPLPFLAPQGLGGVPSPTHKWHQGAAVSSSGADGFGAGIATGTGGASEYPYQLTPQQQLIVAAQASASPIRSPDHRQPKQIAEDSDSKGGEEKTEDDPDEEISTVETELGGLESRLQHQRQRSAARAAHKHGPAASMRGTGSTSPGRSAEAVDVVSSLVSSYLNEKEQQKLGSTIKQGLEHRLLAGGHSREAAGGGQGEPWETLVGNKINQGLYREDQQQNAALSSFVSPSLSSANNNSKQHFVPVVSFENKGRGADDRNGNRGNHKHGSKSRHHPTFSADDLQEPVNMDGSVGPLELDQHFSAHRASAFLAHRPSFLPTYSAYRPYTSRGNPATTKTRIRSRIRGNNRGVGSGAAENGDQTTATEDRIDFTAKGVGTPTVAVDLSSSSALVTSGLPEAPVDLAPQLKPDLCIQTTLADGREARIHVHDGDNAYDLTDLFIKRFCLPVKYRVALVAMIKSRVKRYADALDRKNYEWEKEQEQLAEEEERVLREQETGRAVEPRFVPPLLTYAEAK